MQSEEKTNKSALPVSKSTVNRWGGVLVVFILINYCLKLEFELKWKLPDEDVPVICNLIEIYCLNLFKFWEKLGFLHRFDWLDFRESCCFSACPIPCAWELSISCQSPSISRSQPIEICHWSSNSRSNIFLAFFFKFIYKILTISQ